MKKIIAADMGTTLLKCVLFDQNGNVLMQEQLNCHLRYPMPGWVQQDAQFWYDGVCTLIGRFVEAYGAEDIAGICISSQGISIVPVDAEYQPLMEAVSWLDTRAEAEIAEMEKIFSADEWFAQTGKFISACYTLPKILWLRKHCPELTERTYKYLLPMDYLNARMTGRAVTDHTMAAGTMCYRISSGSWDTEIMEKLGLDESLFPEIILSGELVGAINAETAQKTGLLTDTLVFNGGQDQKVAAFAAGITFQSASISLGTAGALEILVEDASKQKLLPFFPYIHPNQTLVEGCINTAGAAIQWVKDTVFSNLSFDEMNSLAAASPVGSKSVQFYPHLSKPGTPHRGESQFGSIHGISLGVGRGELIRSLYEGLAYEIRLNLEQAYQAGGHTKALFIFGGGSKSEVFCQIIADVTGLKVCAFENGELCSIGAAKLALKGLRLDLEDFVTTAAGLVKEYLPDMENVVAYKTLYIQYLQRYEKENWK